MELPFSIRLRGRKPLVNNVFHKRQYLPILWPGIATILNLRNSLLLSLTDPGQAL
jgi:hypothetical protein